MMCKKTMYMALAAVLCLSSCNNDYFSKQDMGAVTGGLVGGVIGAQFGKGDGQVAAAAAGAILGSMVGNSVGASMDEQSKAKMADVLENTQTNHSRTWVDPDGNKKYTVKPVSTVKENNKVCRKYKMSVVIDDKLESAAGKACRNDDGTWTIVS